MHPILHLGTVKTTVPASERIPGKALDGATRTMIGWPQTPVGLETLRQQVKRRLAELGHLEEDAFPMTERVVVRSGNPCGIYFCLHGPRSVKLTAVLDMQQKNVLFYGSDGTRTETMDLEDQAFAA